MLIDNYNPCSTQGCTRLVTQGMIIYADSSFRTSVHVYMHKCMEGGGGTGQVSNPGFALSIQNGRDSMV